MARKPTTSQKKKPDKGGRPSKLTPDVQDEICLALRTGSFAEPAALYAGVAKATFYSWLDRGRKDREAGRNSTYRGFLDAVERASAQAEVFAVGQLYSAINPPPRKKGRPPPPMPDVRATVEFLSRRFPDRWGRQKIDLGGTPGAQTVNIYIPKEDPE